MNLNRTNRKARLLILPCILFCMYSGLEAQQGGIGVKFSQSTYKFSAHPTSKHFLNSLYISIKLGRGMTIFIDSYLYSFPGEGFVSNTEPKQEIKRSVFDDRATVLGPMYFHKLPKFNLHIYAGIGLGWHSLKLGDDDDPQSKETSKNYGVHLLAGLSYDLKRVPVILFFEARNAYIFLKNDSGADKYVPTALHRSGTITLTGFSAGLLIYFF
ncbi:hypothetical protein JXJ21_19215 [candidate division KSB1 bacterium]|nr:hypothetical protein [candidate division KSB1 bacterium]